MLHRFPQIQHHFCNAVREPWRAGALWSFKHWRVSWSKGWSKGLAICVRFPNLKPSIMHSVYLFFWVELIWTAKMRCAWFIPNYGTFHRSNLIHSHDMSINLALKSVAKVSSGQRKPLCLCATLGSRRAGIRYDIVWRWLKQNDEGSRAYCLAGFRANTLGTTCVFMCFLFGD